MINEIDIAAVLSIAKMAKPIKRDNFSPVLSQMNCRNYAKNEAVFSSGDDSPPEIFLLNGILRSYLSDSNAREVTLNFHCAPCIYTPAIARSYDNQSRINCVALTESRVVSLPSQTLIECMIYDPEIQQWGDAVLRQELFRRVDREWALAALSAKERLEQFRKDFPDLEEKIPHHLIASYIGITPVSLSRIRQQSK